MKTQSDFLFGDAWWAYLVSHENNRHEIQKREDVAAETSEEQGSRAWEGFNPLDWSNGYDGRYYD